MSERSVKTSSRRVQPGTLAHAIDKLIIEQEGLRNQFRNMCWQGVASTPTTGSTQAAGVGNTDWNVNLSVILVTVAGVTQHFVPQADYDVFSGAYYTALANGSSAITALVAINTAGTITLAVVNGTAAVTGSQVAPTDAEIQASVGAGISWVKIAELTLNRTGNVSVTQAEDNAFRPIPGLTEDVNLGDWSGIADG